MIIEKNELYRACKEHKDYHCENCKLKAQSPLGRLWRWHINFCPGWKAYFIHQDEETKAELRGKYNFHKYQ